MKVVVGWCAFSATILGLFAWAVWPTEYTSWVMDQKERCYAMGGLLFHDRKNLQVECYRHPVARMTKTMFIEQYRYREKTSGRN